MSIAPSSTIKLYKNIPLDNTYKHTLYFGSRSAQTSYFNGLDPSKVLTLTPNTYQRVNKGVFRAAHSPDSMYSYNYMSFINDNSHYERKTFYAFITKVEYVNDNVCDVYYEIDVMQTWLPSVDYNLGKQYVEREHIAVDTFGANIVPEPFDVGEYVYADEYESIYDFNEHGYEYLVGYTNGWNAPPITNPNGCMYDGVASVPMVVCHNAAGLNDILDNAQGLVHTMDDIKFIYIVPKGFITYSAWTTNIGYLDSGFHTTSQNHTCASLDTTASFKDRTNGETYTPKNKKLYTYPYNFYSVINSTGDSLSLRYEFFKDFTPSFHLKGTYLQPVQVDCLPRNYKNMGSSNYSEFISINNFPTCSWVSDTYKNWLAQDSVTQAVNGLASTAISAAQGAMVGGTAGAVVKGGMSAVNNAINFGVNKYLASIHTDLAKGKSTGSVLLSNGNLYIKGYRTHISRNMCKCIDDFFTRFGYATNEIKVPNIHSRRCWNFVKTNGCTITGSIPAPMLKMINDIFDGGVTFWKPTATVGDYGQDNP